MSVETPTPPNTEEEKQQEEKEVTEDTKKEINNLKQEVTSSLPGIPIGPEHEIAASKLAKAPAGWQFLVPRNVSVNGQDIYPYSPKTERLVRLNNFTYDPRNPELTPDRENRMEEHVGHFNLPYNHYKLEDLKETAQFQQFMQAVDNLLKRTDSPVINQKILEQNPELKKAQKFNIFEFTVWGHASPKSAGIDPYTGEELTNEQLARYRAEAARDYLLEKGVPAEKITLKWSAHTTLPEEFYDQESPSDADIPGIGFHVVGTRSQREEKFEHNTVAMDQQSPDAEVGGIGFNGLAGLPEARQQEILKTFQGMNNDGSVKVTPGQTKKELIEPPADL